MGDLICARFLVFEKPRFVEGGGRSWRGEGFQGGSVIGLHELPAALVSSLFEGGGEA